MLHENFPSFLRYYISLYYDMRRANPGILFQSDRHTREVENIEDRYWEELETKYPDWNTDENRAQLKREIDFILGVFSTQEKRKHLRNLLKDAIKDKI